MIAEVLLHYTLLSKKLLVVVLFWQPALRQRRTHDSFQDQLKPLAQTQAQQLALQAAAAFAILFLAIPYFSIQSEPLPWGWVSVSIGALALLLSAVSRQPWWWRIIHFFFAPVTWAVSELKISPGWFLLAFLMTLLIFRGAVQGRIPLYLSNKTTARKLAQFIVDARRQSSFIDLGAGVGSIVSRLCTALPASQITGIENAPITWLIGRIRTLRRQNCEWRWGDLWDTDLSRFDVVYAFLSPAPMADLWEKAAHEMRPGSVFISNSFPIPGIAADQVIEIEDKRQTALYCYNIRSIKDEFRCAPQQPLPGSG